MKLKKPAPAINTKVKVSLLTFLILIVSIIIQL
jgi:hypothetical protein